MSSTWKPCDRLTVDDFARNAVWTYDLARAERDEKADETWVRPARAGQGSFDDEIFARATLLDRDGRPVPRCVVTLRPGARKGARPRLTSLVVLSPYYEPTPIEDDTLARTLSPAMQRLLPISYEVDVKVGAERVRTKGKLTLWQPAPPPPAPEEPSPIDELADQVRIATPRAMATKQPSTKKPAAKKRSSKTRTRSGD